MYNWDENPDLNITPLVDVMLVLMAILMITAPAVMFQEDINLPSGSQTKAVVQEESIEINLHRDGSVIFEKQEMPFSAFADSFILQSADYDPATTVYINADESLKYSKVMELIKVVKQAGFEKASLVTHE